MTEQIEKTIDIDKVLRSKMGARSKWVPRVLVNWLKHILHEDEVNRFLWETQWHHWHRVAGTLREISGYDLEGRRFE